MRSNVLGKPLVHFILIAALGMLVYSNTLNVPFHFDDEFNITENHIIRDASNIPSILAGAEGPFASRPLMHVTFALNYYFGGLDTTGYHVVNIALHMLNGVLLYLLVVMTGRQMEYDDDRVRPVALVSALLFIAHPVQTEAVTYTVSRSMLMATTFYITCFILFLKAVTSERKRNVYLLALFVASICGMGSRENSATLPLMLFLFDLFFVSRFSMRKAASHYMAYIPVLVSLIYLVHLILNNTYDTVRDYPTRNIPHVEYALTEFKVQWTYLRLLVIPVNQVVDYDYTISKTLLDPRTALSFTGYVGLWTGALLMARRRPFAAFAVLWFLVTLFPISFGVALLKSLKLDDVISEHRLYLPSVAFFPLAAAGIFLALDAIWAERRKTLAAALIPLLVLALGSASYARNHVWQSGISLWQDVVKKSPMKARGHYNLGLYYSERKFYTSALEEYEIAARLAPDDYIYINNLGAAYKNVGLVDKAIEHYRRALELNPKLSMAYNNLGNAYESKRMLDDAMEYYLKAVELDPTLEIALYNLGSAYMKQGKFEDAIHYFREALRIDPNDPYAHNGLGFALGQQGRLDEAIAHFEAALSLKPDYENARENLDIARRLKDGDGRM